MRFARALALPVESIRSALESRSQLYMASSCPAFLLDEPPFQMIRLLSSDFRAREPEFFQTVRQLHRIGAQANDIG